MRLVDVVMVVVTVVAALTLLTALLAKFISPQSVWLPAFAGLFYPIIYIANIFCALWWVVRWQRWFFLSAAMALLGMGQIGLFYRSDLAVERDEVVERSKNDLVVVTYNVMNFADHDDVVADEGEDVDNFSRVAEWINQQGANVVVMQEAHFSSGKSFEELKGSLRRMNYGYFVPADSRKEEDVTTGSGYAILSSYPMVRKGVAHADNTNVISVWADLRVGRDTVRIYNNHLQSHSITKQERINTLSPQVFADSMAHERLSEVVHKMAGNYKIRAEQAEVVSNHIASSPHPVVVVGDFNDTPASYVYRTIKHQNHLQDAFVEKGRGAEYTFKGLFNLFRIDYVLADKERFYVKEYRSADVPMSDHKPLVVRLGVVDEFED